MKIFALILNKIRYIYHNFLTRNIKRQLGHCGEDVIIGHPFHSSKSSHIYLYDHTNIYGYSLILIVSGKFIMKRNSGAAQGLTVVTGNHTSRPGIFFKELIRKEDIEKDVVVEEDVWIGAQVTLLAGVTIGRGAIIGAGSVCRKSIPPYATVIGNPAKIIGFKFSPEEIIEHEEALYPPEERIPEEILRKNYDKYFIQRLEEIKQYLK